MPVQKRYHQTVTLLSSPSPPLGEEKDDDSLPSNENHNQEQAENHGCDSDGCSYSSDGEKDEYFICISFCV
ncbi:hypothetical protein CDL12_18840 [Handroanthus impetiginosus]|uniref:Uncharacterized protein n=1 Tax=Handroanthus impetiginosus TaxID=429701 RepID=A0A2G9GTK2_9LAMI|nr:hypothetical protein CDL12_18840 [Handroanthus impetiginosus]